MATAEDDMPFDDPDSLRDEVAGEGGGGSEESGPTLEDTLGSLGEEGEAAGQPEAPEETAEPEGGAAEGQTIEEATSEAEEGVETPEAEEEAPEEAGEAEESKVRYRDPESGQFISAEKARAKGLEPEELETDEEAAEHLFGEEEPEEPEEPAVEPVTLEVEGEEEGEGFTLEIAPEDEEVREAIAELQEDARRARDLEAEVEHYREMEDRLARDREELDLIEAELREDPVPFLLDNVPKNDRARTALRILATDDEAWEALEDRIEKWRRNPAERKAFGAETRAEIAETRTERKEKVERQVKGRRQGQKIARRLETVARQADERHADQLFEDLRRDTLFFVEQNNVDFLTMEEVAQIPRVRKRLEMHGIDPSVLADGSQSTRERGPSTARSENGRKVARAEPGGEEEQELLEKAEEYRRHGEQLRRAHARRKDVGSTTPSGAGGQPSNQGQPPEDATLEEALDMAEERMGR